MGDDSSKFARARGMTGDAQAALRRVMENYAKMTRCAGASHRAERSHRARDGGGHKPDGNQVQSCSIKLILVRSRYIKYNRV